MIPGPHTLTHTHTHTTRRTVVCFGSVRLWDQRGSSIIHSPQKCFSSSFLPPWKTEFMTRHLFCWLHRPSAASVNDFPAILVASQNTWWHKWHEKYAIQFVSGYYFVARTVTVMFWLRALSVDLDRPQTFIFFKLWTVFKSREKCVHVSLASWRSINVLFVSDYISFHCQAHLLLRGFFCAA